MINYKNSRSSSMQESFVISMTEEKNNGFYVELGSADPHIESNTLLLEKEFGWTGLPLEINTDMAKKYNESNRTNKCINADALTFDYLQIDIDGHDEGNCLLALLALPMLQYRFSVIIIEHDVSENYKRSSMRDAQREILSSLRYKLIGQTLSEDWWVDPKSINNKVYRNEIFNGQPPCSGVK